MERAGGFLIITADDIAELSAGDRSALAECEANPGTEVANALATLIQRLIRASPPQDGVSLDTHSNDRREMVLIIPVTAHANISSLLPILGRHSSDGWHTGHRLTMAPSSAPPDRAPIPLRIPTPGAGDRWEAAAAHDHHLQHLAPDLLLDAECCVLHSSNGQSRTLSTSQAAILETLAASAGHLVSCDQLAVRLGQQHPNRQHPNEVVVADKKTVYNNIAKLKKVMGELSSSIAIQGRLGHGYWLVENTH